MVEVNQLIDEGYVSKDEPQDANSPLISSLHQLILTLTGRLILKILSSCKMKDRNSRAYVIKFNDIFSESLEDIGKTPLIQMDIDTGDSLLVCQHPIYYL